MKIGEYPLAKEKIMHMLMDGDELNVQEMMGRHVFLHLSQGEFISIIEAMVIEKLIVEIPASPFTSTIHSLYTW